MAWSNSKPFIAWMTDIANNTTAMDLNTDSLLEAALFDNSITPSNTVSSANSAYAAGVWASGGVSDSSGWPALGRPLASVSSTSSSAVYTFTAANTASANSTTTLSSVYGVLVYDHSIATPVADQGICFSYLGGTNSVTSGSFTVAWSGSGIVQVTF
jgi:hypothetical protein